jgi:hypothetical protein
MSRAGLVSFVFFFLFVGLATSVPLAERPSSLVERHDDYGIDFAARSLAILDDREFDIADFEYTKREYDLSGLDERNLEDSEYTKRDDSDVHMLYRRKSIFTKIKQGFQKAAHAVKTFVQHTGAKIAKFGLKLVAAGASVVSKALKFIPGVGTGLSMAVKGVAMGANAASNKIHANLGGKLGKVSKGLDDVINPFGAAANAAGKKNKAIGAVAKVLF